MPSTHKSKLKINHSKLNFVICGFICPVSALVILTGCLKETKPVAAVDRSPLIVDEAMQQRNFKRSTVRFQNGETNAWPTGFILEHNPNAPKWTPVVTETPLFLANVAMMPVGYLFTPPWTRVIYPAGVVEPSFTGVPPLPPSAPAR